MARPATVPAYVCDFKQESQNIRKAAGDASNVFVAMDASTYQYAPGTSHDRGGGGQKCTYIPPASYVDFCLADHYNTRAAARLADDQHDRQERVAVGRNPERRKLATTDGGVRFP